MSQHLSDGSSAWFLTKGLEDDSRAFLSLGDFISDPRCPFESKLVHSQTLDKDEVTRTTETFSGQDPLTTYITATTTTTNTLHSGAVSITLTSPDSTSYSPGLDNSNPSTFDRSNAPSPDSTSSSPRLGNGSPRPFHRSDAPSPESMSSSPRSDNGNPQAFNRSKAPSPESLPQSPGSPGQRSDTRKTVYQHWWDRYSSQCQEAELGPASCVTTETFTPTHAFARAVIRDAHPNGPRAHLRMHLCSQGRYYGKLYVITGTKRAMLEDLRTKGKGVDDIGRHAGGNKWKEAAAAAANTSTRDMEGMEREVLIAYQVKVVKILWMSISEDSSANNAGNEDEADNEGTSMGGYDSESPSQSSSHTLDHASKDDDDEGDGLQITPLAAHNNFYMGDTFLHLHGWETLQAVEKETSAVVIAPRPISLVRINV